MDRLFDPMGTAKGILLEPWYRGVKDGRLLPPVQAMVNPVHGCNLACLCCEFAPEEDGEAIATIRMPEGHLVKVVEMLGEWGVKSVVFGAVGEATMHPELAEAMVVARMVGLEVNLVTTGVHVPEPVADAIMSLGTELWVKIPANEAETYQAVTRRRGIIKVKGLPETLRAGGSPGKVKIGWMYEMCNLNFDETVAACETARKSGYDAFYARVLTPGAGKNRVDAEAMTQGIGAEEMEAISKGCGALETNGFAVTVEMPQPRGGFHQCYAAPLVVHIGADGYVYFCGDRYGDEEMVLGKHWPEPGAVPRDIWGSGEHLDLLRTDTPYFCTAGCTLRPYHQAARAMVWEGDNPLRRWNLVR